MANQVVTETTEAFEFEQMKGMTTINRIGYFERLNMTMIVLFPHGLQKL